MDKPNEPKDSMMDRTAQEKGGKLLKKNRDQDRDISCYVLVHQNIVYRKKVAQHSLYEKDLRETMRYMVNVSFKSQETVEGGICSSEHTSHMPLKSGCLTQARNETLVSIKMNYLLPATCKHRKTKGFIWLQLQMKNA